MGSCRTAGGPSPAPRGCGDEDVGQALSSSTAAVALAGDTRAGPARVEKGPGHTQLGGRPMLGQEEALVSSLQALRWGDSAGRGVQCGRRDASWCLCRRSPFLRPLPIPRGVGPVSVSRLFTTQSPISGLGGFSNLLSSGNGPDLPLALCFLGDRATRVLNLGFLSQVFTVQHMPVFFFFCVSLLSVFKPFHFRHVLINCICFL